MLKPERLNSVQIIQALQLGKTETLDEIYETWREDFFRWAGRRFDGTRQDFEDAWQVAIIAFFEQVTTGKLTDLRFSPRVWLFTVGYRHLLKSNRKTKRIIWRDTIDEALLKDEQLPEYQWDETPSDEWALVEKAMQAVSPQCREMLVQRFYEGKKIPDIMAFYGHNAENTTSATLSRCLKRLREIVFATTDAERTMQHGK